MLITTALLLSLSGPLTSTTAERPRLAVGMEGELAPPMSVDAGPVSVGLPSLAVTLAFRRPIGLQLLAGSGWSSTRTTSPIESNTRTVGAHGSLRLLLWPLRGDRGRVGVVLQAGYRGAWGGEDAELQTRALRRHGLVAAAGLRPEVFVTPRISLHTQLGVAYTLDSDNTTEVTQSLRLAGQLLGQAGVSLWFF